MEENCLAKLTASGVEVRLDRLSLEPGFTGKFYFRDHCNLNMGLTPRPPHSRTCYAEKWRPDHYEELGKIVFLPHATEIFAASAAGDYVSLTCVIDARLFDIDPPNLNETELVRILNVNCAAVRQGMRRMLREITTPSFATSLAVEGTAMVLAADLSRFVGLSKDSHHKVGGLAPAKLRLVEDRIRSSLPPPRITELAALCGLSTRHLARMFQVETGLTVSAFIQEVQLERACRMLRYSDTPIKRLAVELGFTNSTSFGFAFRRATGLSPRRFRNGATAMMQ